MERPTMNVTMLRGRLQIQAPNAEANDPKIMGSRNPNLLIIMPEGRSATIRKTPKLETEAPTRKRDELNAYA